ncbi:aminotransferase class I/II-fold pyridoxal phosphate-dependent enzyme [Mycobacterium tuberculosis]|uniref:aminotransferase class I/II-fold pyridoxal phosphate-dependent enzyme n=1 Tax=Mycobacterium tuberculosis TaxID=1773 RepID=UPI0035107639
MSRVLVQSAEPHLRQTELVPVEDLIAAAARAMRRDGRALSKYGLDSGPLGYRPLREFLVGKLKRDAGITCTADEILITQGSLQGLDFVNAVLVAPGDTVIIEEMTYGGAITRLQRAKANIVGVPVDHDGLRARAGGGPDCRGGTRHAPGRPGAFQVRARQRAAGLMQRWRAMLQDSKDIIWLNFVNAEACKGLQIND